MGDISSIVELASQFAISNGILKSVNDSPTLLPCTLVPTPFPSVFLNQGLDVQCDLNLLYHKAALDYEFLQSIFTPLIPHDNYIGRLWSIYIKTNDKEKSQKWFLGLNRSDYLLHFNRYKEGKTENLTKRLKCTKEAAKFNILTEQKHWNGVSLLQVEFNMMASGLAGLIPRIIQQHRVISSLCGIKTDLDKRIPDSCAANGFSDAFHMAYQTYRQQYVNLTSDAKKLSILIVVSVNEGNMYDQRALINSLILKYPDVNVLHRTFEYLKTNLILDEERRLIVDNEEIAVVYFRTGYSPDSFPDEETWNVKYQLELSMAIKCPCIQYMLVNTKIVQAALSKPKYLTRYFPADSDIYCRLMKIFAKQYTLVDDYGLTDKSEIQTVLNECINSPENYVLKPQREGGGNNYFGASMIEKLKSIMHNKDGAPYVLMERMRPNTSDNYILTSSTGKPLPKRTPMHSELGIFGTFIACGDKVILNECTGHLLRSKPADSTEGGIVAGFGCLDSPFLV